MEIELPEKLFGPIALDLETRDEGLAMEIGPGWAWSGGGDVAGIAIKADNFCAYLPIGHFRGDNLDRKKIIRWLNVVLSDPNQPKIFANASYDLGWFRRIGVIFPGPYHDVQVQAPLLDEYKFSYQLDALGKEYLSEGKDEQGLASAVQKYCKEEIGRKKKITSGMVKGLLWKLPYEEVETYAKQDAELTRKLWEFLTPKIQEEDLQRVYNVEMGLIPLLIEMRWRGVRVDLKKAEIYAKEFYEAEVRCLEEIKRETGVELELTMADSKAKVLDYYGIPYPLTDKTKQPKIEAKWVEERAEELKIPTISLMVKAAKYRKARSDFIEKFIFGHNQGGYIHASFNPLKSDEGGTVGGRFSSSDPNLQQLPKRDEEIGPKIRELYLPNEGELFASADYSAQEPRWTAEWAYRAGIKGGSEVAERYRNDPHTDFHQMVADMVGIGRKQAKVINLGLTYGMGGGKLCRGLGLPYVTKEFKGKIVEVPGPEGEELIRRFHENAPFIKGLMDLTKKIANQRGYIMTALGRRCRFPFKDGYRWYSHKALNRLVQGSSADQTKMAMLNMWNEGIVPLVTVHDELCFSVPDEATAHKYGHMMEVAIETYVPFISDVKVGENWGKCL